MESLSKSTKTTRYRGIRKSSDESYKVSNCIKP